MTPDEVKAFHSAAKSGKIREAVLHQYKQMRATVRVMCGYTPTVMRGLTWEELCAAYEDCLILIVNNNKFR